MIRPREGRMLAACSGLDRGAGGEVGCRASRQRRLPAPARVLGHRGHMSSSSHIYAKMHVSQ